MKHVRDSLYRRPVYTEAVLRVPHGGENFVDDVHCRCRKVGGGVEMWSEAEHLLFLGQVLVDSGDLVLLGGRRVKHPQSFHRHGMNGVSDGLIVVTGKSRLVEGFLAGLTRLCSDDR